jgi:hypothetical protein
LDHKGVFATAFSFLLLGLFYIGRSTLVNLRRYSKLLFGDDLGQVNEGGSLGLAELEHQAEDLDDWVAVALPESLESLVD